MKRFLLSRTGALLMLGIMTVMLGFGLRQKSAAPLLGQTTLQCDLYICQDAQRPVMRITAIPWYHPAVGSSDGTGNQFGRAVADIGDFDGDGMHDLAVGTIDDDRVRSIRILLLNTNGTVKQRKTIAIERAGLTGYRDVHEVGISVAPLGDLDGDGVVDLAIGTRGVSDTGWPLWDAWTLFLRSDATVKSLQHIAGNRDLPNAGMDEAFGEDIVNIGDLDQDGVIDLAVTGPRRNTQTTSGGVLTIVFLNRDGTMKSNQRISGAEYGGLAFAISVAALGDYNGDGMIEVAVGSEGCDYSFVTGVPHVNKNAVYILSLRNDGTVASSMELNQPDNLPECTSPSPPLFTFGAALANVGDWNGDGVTDLAVSTLTSDKDDVWIALLNPNGGAAYGRIPQEGNSQWWQRNMSGQAPMYFRSFGSALTSLPDRDGDGKRELVVGDILNTYCGPTYFAGSVWVYPTSRLDMRFSANAWEVRDMTFKTGTYCDSCRSSGACPALACGNGLPESLVDGTNEEQCGEPGLSSCGTGYSCQNCRCVAAAVSSSAASSSLSSPASSSAVSSVAVSSLSSSRSSSSTSSSTATASVSSSQSSSAVSSATASSVSSFTQSASSGEASSAFTSSSTAAASSASSQAGIGFSSVSSVASALSSSTGIAVSSASSAAAQASSVFNPNQPSLPSTPRCGNGMLETGEACESGIPCADGGFCTAQCQCRSAGASSRSEEVSANALCGDGILSPGEGCDSGIPCADGGLCTASCMCQARNATTSLCGNGILNIREECDDGNAIDGDGCDTRCRREVVTQAQECGNGFLDGNEQCETTSPCPRPEDECRNCQCFVPAGPVCGNGLLESPEQCETTSPCPDSTYICSRCTCLAPVCGDGTRTQGEECDDGNSADGDGCSGSCRKELPSFIASQELCGNGIAEEGEQCDDGNQLDRDGCSAACTVEPLPAATQDFAGLSLIAERPPEGAVSSSSVPTLIPVRTGPSPKKAPALPSSTGVRPQMHPAAAFSVPATIPPTSFPVAATVTQQTTQYPAYWQPYGSVVPVTAPSGPVGKTGPASLAIMVSGAAAGLSFMRLKKRH